MKFLRLDKKGRMGGAYILYYAEHLKAIHRKDPYTPGLEAIWPQVKFTYTLALFAVLYRPPNDNKYFDSVRIPLEKAWLNTSNIFLLGDMNCDLCTDNYSAHSVTNKNKLQSIMDNSCHWENLPLPLSDSIICRRTSTYPSRKPDSVFLPRFNSRFVHFSITYRGAALWNNTLS